MNLSIEQQQMVLDNQLLVYHLVNKLGVSPNDYEDIASVGTIGLIKAASSFDKSKGVKFSTYASRCINNEIFMYFRKQKIHLNDVSLYTLIGIDNEGHEFTLYDKIPDTTRDFTEEIANNEIFVNFINIILNCLQPRDRLIMLYRIANINQKSIEKTLNISQSYISRRENKLTKKVKLYLESGQKFKEVFSMAIVGDSYQISFFSKDVKHFNEILGKFFLSIESVEALPNFKIRCNNGRIIILVPAHPESFAFIGKIIHYLDDYGLDFVSYKDTSPVERNLSQKVKTDDSNKKEITKHVSQSNSEKKTSTKPVNQSNTKKKAATEHVSQSMKIREYILTLESFTVKQIISQFPDISTTLIRNVINQSKYKGLIKSTSRGQYVITKN